MQALQYSELPTEDLDESRQVVVPVKTSTKRTPLSIAGVALLFTAALVLVVVASSKLFAPKIVTSAVEETEWLRDYRARATGDEYLLGTGKADVTGYVKLTFMYF